MSNTTNLPRLFIHPDPADQSSKIARWVQVNLTDQFVAKIQKLHKLLDAHSIEQITVKADVNWCLSADWQILNSFGIQESWLDIWEGVFTIRSNVSRVNIHSSVSAVAVLIHASYTWANMDEDYGDFCLNAEGHRFDCLQTAQGRSDPVLGQADLDIDFAKIIDAHLAEFGKRPLLLISSRQEEDDLNSALKEPNW